LLEKDRIEIKLYKTEAVLHPAINAIHNLVFWTKLKIIKNKKNNNHNIY
jgi:hypothetical protein